MIVIFEYDPAISGARLLPNESRNKYSVRSGAESFSTIISGCGPRRKKSYGSTPAKRPGS
jgi:hypothetical protein